MIAVEGWQITEWAVAITAILAAITAVWTKIIRPVLQWGQRIEQATMWTEEQMRPNGGSTLVDKVDMLLKHDLERDVYGQRFGHDPDQKPSEATLTEKVDMLLRHDADRDRPGRRYENDEA